jgi:hypothetical protein
VLIPSLYATSLRTRSLRPVRVPSDHNTRWRLHSIFPPIRDKNSLVSPYFPDPHTLERGRTIAATPHTCDTSFLLFIFLDPSKKTLFILYYSSYNKFLGFYIWSTDFVHGYHNGVSDPLRDSRECYFV